MPLVIELQRERQAAFGEGLIGVRSAARESAARPCTGATTAADTVEALKARILGQMPVRCDEPAWSLWGISLAGWNLLASLVTGGACCAVFWRLRAPRRQAEMRRETA